MPVKAFACPPRPGVAAAAGAGDAADGRDEASSADNAEAPDVSVQAGSGTRVVRRRSLPVAPAPAAPAEGATAAAFEVAPRPGRRARDGPSPPRGAPVRWRVKVRGGAFLLPVVGTFEVPVLRALAEGRS